MYLFNFIEWCYIKHTTDNVLQILLQASLWRVKTANTILQIPWKKAKSCANTSTWSKNSANSQYKAWICKKYHGY
jgi:S-ribosylhomocysteine lyase LuxS involved in autoinducer biosynthesis